MQCKWMPNYAGTSVPTLTCPLCGNAAYRVAVIYLVGFTYRFKYYFAWTVAEAALVLSGFCWNGWDASGKPRWDRYSNARILQVTDNQP